MSKQDFLLQLRNGLNGLPPQEIDERVTFYGEMIDDRMEEGLSEEEAVRGIGSVEEIVFQILAEIPLTKCIKEKIRPKRSLGAVEIVLLVLGSPIWLSLLIAFASVVFSVYISLWSVIIALWAVFGAVIVCGVSGIAVGILFAVAGYGTTCLAYIGASIVSIGLAIFLFFGCKEATKGLIVLLKNFLLWLKRKFIK